MSNRELSKDAKIFINGKALIEDKTNWWGKDYAAYRDIEEGGKIHYCAMQALYAASNQNSGVYNRLCSVMDDHARKLFGGFRAMEVNDMVGHEAVMKIYDAAIQEELNKVPESVES